VQKTRKLNQKPGFFRNTPRMQFLRPLEVRNPPPTIFFILRKTHRIANPALFIWKFHPGNPNPASDFRYRHRIPEFSVSGYRNLGIRSSSRKSDTGIGFPVPDLLFRVILRTDTSGFSMSFTDLKSVTGFPYKPYKLNRFNRCSLQQCHINPIFSR